MKTKTGFLEKLEQILTNSKSKYKIGELLDYFGKDSIIVFLFLITFITSLPLPPWGGGFETIPGGIVSIFLALQGLLGFNTVYMPDTVKELEINIKFVQESKYVNKTFDMINTYIEPNRNKYVFNIFTEKLMYLLVIPNALLMILPMLFTNGLPSLCITLMTIMWLLSDGLLFTISLAVSVFAIIAYIFLLVGFAKWLYNTRRIWSFGLWQ
jgi:hypothetical protein|tara:strand:+ start:56 stop:688 length:633 start_codon:yes stop_codon:yes gene_type:complete